jgi:putative MATE family efflux protein
MLAPMSQTTALPLDYSRRRSPNRELLRELMLLAMPVWAEQALHMMVGINDTYLANHLPKDAASAGAAVGTITYFLWFIGLLVGAVGTGSTAMISRAKGARHQRLANSVTGQSVSAALLIGIVVGVLLFTCATPIIAMTQLQGTAHGFAFSYLRMLSISLPFTMVMFIAGSCQRGGGDTVTPAIVMVIVDIINMLFSFALCRGWFGLPVMGFEGIAAGTIIAYISGGVIQMIVLTRRSSVVRLHLHRLRPHWVTLKRLFRVGVPAMIEGLLAWLANFGVIAIINHVDPTNVMSSAHMNTIRIEGISFLSGMAFATAAATMVGTNLGRKDPARATKSAYMAFFVAAAFMGLCGLLMITLGRFPAQWISPGDPRIIHLTTKCLMVTGFIQIGFAACVVFGGALRGAGDTLTAMTVSLMTIFCLRFTGVIIVGWWLRLGLVAVWCVLAGELFIRGVCMYLRFASGAWKRTQV